MKFLTTLSAFLFLSFGLIGQDLLIEFDSYNNNLEIDGEILEFPTTTDELKKRFKSDFRQSGKIAYFDNMGIYAVIGDDSTVVELSIQFSQQSGRATTTNEYKGKFKFDGKPLSEKTTEKELRAAIRASHFPYNLLYNTVVNIRNGNKAMVFIVTPDSYLDSFLLRHEEN